MYLAHIEKLYALTTNDCCLYDKLVAQGQQLKKILVNSFREARPLGYFFTLDKAIVSTKANQTLKSNGELNDNQLEAVAGGKSETIKLAGRNTLKSPAHPATRDALAQAFECKP